MSVLITTSLGSITVDLFTEETPKACENFLKLCKAKYYHGCLFWSVHIWGLIGQKTNMNRRTDKSFKTESSPHRALNKIGLVCMAHSSGDEGAPNRSQFFITLNEGRSFEHLQGKHSIFGEIVEGMDTIKAINELYCDSECRPYQDVRILHTDILHDPFQDPNGLADILPLDSPKSSNNRHTYIPEEEQVTSGLTYGQQQMKEQVTESTAVVLEMLGDLPDADVKPPDEVLFVCKLNPVTREDDLEVIFSRFGRVKSCSILRDHQTGASLQYAFIEFDAESSCLRAYEKMNNVLIDDRRIKVDFSQSVAKIWNKFNRDGNKFKQADVIQGAKQGRRHQHGNSNNYGRREDCLDRKNTGRARSRSRSRERYH
eukprot:GSChrysophyteH1.ASY1.ANO1.2363.1 assembled CDS